MEYFSNEFFLIALTFGSYFLGKLLRRWTGWVIMNPILVSIVCIITFLELTGISYETYNQGGHMIEFWLRPAVVALGVPLYMQLSTIKKQLTPILLSELAGCVVGIISVVYIAKEMGAKWEQTAREGDHYRLAFDRYNSWIQKYNMVWDKLWGTNVFPNNAMQKEIKYYLGKQNKYGLPLDSRKDYSKNDWIMWTAAMAPDNKTFLKFVDPIWKYMNETESRVPTSDWYDTKTGLMQGFKARSVIGGFWMKVLADKLAQKNK